MLGAMQLIILASALTLAAAASTQLSGGKESVSSEDAFKLFFDDNNNKAKQQICVAPTTAPHKVEKVLSQCQDEIKNALLQEALSVLGQSVGRQKRQAFTGEERRIAGCLLQCVYRKMKAVDENGFPTAPALVQMFTEGVKDRNYYLATIQGVQQCLAKEIQQRKSNQTLAEAEGYTCDVAYDMFMCVSEQIESLCGTSP